VFRRRRSADVGQDWPSKSEDGQPLADDEFDDEPGEQEWPAEAPRAEGGPWDAGEPFPPRDRVDLGSLQVPVGPEHDIQIVMADQQGVWVTVRHGESEMQVQAFAAPRRGSLWDDLRADTAREVHQAGGQTQERPGPFGTELLAQVATEPGQPAAGQQVVRFIGVDGPRWFLRGLFIGPAAAGGEAASLLEEIFRDVVVVRGEHPVPPRDILELRLPPEVQKAFEEQQAAAAEENRFRTDLNPFERGPEFTETR
jgi:Protein of unknown function (DUF3710)